ncbi:unnamed protein product, partial [Ceratitis capitata]
ICLLAFNARPCATLCPANDGMMFANALKALKSASQRSSCAADVAVIITEQQSMGAIEQLSSASIAGIPFMSCCRL